METGEKRFLFNCGWYRTLRMLGDTARLRVLDAVIDYVCGNEAAGLDAAESTVFDFIRKEIDKDQAISEKRSEAGRRGGRRGGAPKGNKNACKKIRQDKQNNKTEVVLMQLHENEQDTGQNKAKQSKTKQNKAKQNKTKQTTQPCDNEQDTGVKTTQNRALPEEKKEKNQKKEKREEKEKIEDKEYKEKIYSLREYQKRKKENEERKETDDRPICPPSMGDVAAFANANGIDAQTARRFFLHYQTNGWMAGQYRIRDWRALLTKWNATQAERQAGADDMLHYRYENTDPATINDIAERELAEIRERYGSIFTSRTKEKTPAKGI